MLNLVNDTEPKGASVIPEFRSALLALGLQENAECLANLMTSISEAVANAVKHGKSLCKATADFNDEDHVLTVEITDCGDGFDFTAERTMPEWDAESGRGILFMKGLCDNVSWERTPNGFKCILKKKLFANCEECGPSHCVLCAS